MNHSLLLILIAASLTSCTNLSDKSIEQPTISIIDLNEGKFVKRVLDGSSSKGNFKVEPNRTETVVTFSYPNKPEDEPQFKKFLKEVKSKLSKSRGREANTLVFKFPHKTYRE